MASSKVDLDGADPVLSDTLCEDSDTDTFELDNGKYTICLCPGPPYKRLTSDTTSTTTCSSNLACDSGPPRRNLTAPVRTVQVDGKVMERIDCVDAGYIRMQQDGSLTLMPGNQMPETFEVIITQRSIPGIRPQLFQLRNVQYQNYYITGHIADDMIVDGIFVEDMSKWMIKKVDNDVVKLRLCGQHIPKDTYFCVQKNQGDPNFILGNQPINKFKFFKV